MSVIANRVKMSTSTIGTGTIDLDAAETGYQSFTDGGITNGQVVSYAIEDGAAWEIGTGTYTTGTPNTLSRTVIESSLLGAPIILSGSAVVFITALSGELQNAVDMDQGVATTDSPSFADLTLSGGVYLGGAVAANYLDDYEEGTWTPTITSQTNMSSASWSQGSYRKIGSVVTIQGSFTCTVTSSNTLTYVVLTLPFTTTIGDQTGSAFANNNVHVGVCDLTTTQINPFFPAASGITSGSESIQVSATYIVS